MTLFILYPPKVKDAVLIVNNLPYNYYHMNLNIEGTKHEKAVLVILSYVSGFTAGFIIFGMSALSSARPAESVIYHEPQATDISMNTVDEVAAPVELETPVPTEEVMYKDGRLMANINGASVLLSAQLATVDAETAKTFANQGVHQAIPKYQASDDANFVYYCEQHSEADSCINFIYDVEKQIIQYVTVDGKKLVSNAETAQTAIWNNGLLTIGTATSINATAPWKLAIVQ